MFAFIKRIPGLKGWQKFLPTITGIFLLTGLVSCGLAQAPLMDNIGYKGGSIKSIKKISGAIHFLAVGDWGRNGENYQKKWPPAWEKRRMTFRRIL